MKYITLLLFLIPLFLSAQRKINDPALLAQEKRQVFEQWGDWKPDPVYPKIFGVKVGPNINVPHSMAWGMLAPNRNRRYKNGEDIRPLKATGEENIRQGKAQIMKEQAKAIKKSVDSIYQRSLSDMAHWTSLTTSADPLYLLYYKKMLDPLKKFSENPKQSDWGIKNYTTYSKIKQTGQLKTLQEKLDILKDKYKKATTLDMPRGKRFLMYHETLIGWRELQRMIKDLENFNDNFFIYSRKINQFRFQKENHKSMKQTDKEIANQFIQQYKNQY